MILNFLFSYCINCISSISFWFLEVLTLSISSCVFPLFPLEPLANSSHVYVCCHVQLFATPWTIACQATLYTGFSRQEYWSGLPFPSPGYLPDPGTEPTSLASAGGFFTNWAMREALQVYHVFIYLNVKFYLTVCT